MQMNPVFIDILVESWSDHSDQEFVMFVCGMCVSKIRKRGLIDFHSANWPTNHHLLEFY